MKSLDCLLLVSLLPILFISVSGAEFPVPETPLEFSTGVALYKIDEITIDGRGDEESWKRIEWSEPFVDIRGYDYQPAPWYETRIKMMWDEDYFYILAWLEEPHLWATYDQHDMVIFHENDFEVFIDPDGDNHNYLELEINALGTTWDLMLTKPYRDNGHAIDSWEIPGLKSGIFLDGTLNDPSDIDKGWGVELAIPWEVIIEVDSRSPIPIASWVEELHVNFSRVQWQLDIDSRNSTYMKKWDLNLGHPLPENNWVWSPQGLIAMHYPERWGRVRFSYNPEELDVPFWGTESDTLKECVMSCYYAQKQFYEDHLLYAKEVSLLELPEQSPHPGIEWPPELITAGGGYLITVYNSNQIYGMQVREDGLLTYVRHYNFGERQYKGEKKHELENLD